MHTKFCPGCKVELPISDFEKAKYHKDGHRAAMPSLQERGGERLGATKPLFKSTDA
jgi:hypothetical protein